FGVSVTTFQNIPGLVLTVGTNSTYEFEGCIMLKTSTAAISPRIAIAWPTGTSSVGWINKAQTASTLIQVFGNQLSTMATSSAAALFQNTTACWPAIYGGVVRAFGGAASSLRIQLAAESTGVFVSSMIGSFL